MATPMDPTEPDPVTTSESVASATGLVSISPGFVATDAWLTKALPAASEDGTDTARSNVTLEPAPTSTSVHWNSPAPRSPNTASALELSSPSDATSALNWSETVTPSASDGPLSTSVIVSI